MTIAPSGWSRRQPSLGSYATSFSFSFRALMSNEPGWVVSMTTPDPFPRFLAHSLFLSIRNVADKGRELRAEGQGTLLFGGGHSSLAEKRNRSRSAAGEPLLLSYETFLLFLCDTSLF